MKEAKKEAKRILGEIGKLQYSDPNAKHIFISTPKIALYLVDKIIKTEPNCLKYDMSKPAGKQMRHQGLKYWQSVRAIIERS